MSGEEADRHRQPQRLGREPGGTLLLAGAGRPGDDRRRAVREEVEHRERASQDRPGETERSQLRTPEMPDDAGVDEDVERLRGERAEGREGQAEDLPVVW
jgi:hypothetical protein